MPDRFKASGGKMGQAVSKHNWEGHELGIANHWPQGLELSLKLCLNSPAPMAVCWGKNLYMFYNDAWSPILGDKHPAALGKPASDVWSEIWDVLGPAMKKVMETGIGTISERGMLPMYRRGYVEETYFDYTINPILSEGRKVDGLLLLASEVTNKVLSERRSIITHQLSEVSLLAESPEAACIIAANKLIEAPYDITFARIYLINDNETHIRLVADTNIDDTVGVHTIDLSDDKRLLPYAEVIKNKKPQIVYNIDDSYNLGKSIWPEPTRHVVVLPLTRPNDDDVYGVLVVGISPRLFLDDQYLEFLNDISQKIAFSIGSAVDSKEKQRLESMEIMARERLSAALSSGLMGVWSWNFEKNEITADSNFAKLFNIPPYKVDAGLTAEDFLGLIHPKDSVRIGKKVEKSIQDKSWLEDEYRIITGKKSMRWVLTRGNVIFTSTGRPYKITGVVIDIDARKKIEQKLADSEQVFRSLFESSIVGMSIAKLDGEILDANNAFLKMFGYTRKDLKNGLTSDLLTPAGSKRITKYMYNSLIHNGEVEPIQKNYLKKDGTIIPAMVGAVKMAGHDDRFISFILDLSEQAYLRELNKAKDEFISIASHQLRTPATAVKQYLGMILEGYAGEVPSNQERLIKIAYDSNDHQLTIVNDLLKVAQADTQEIKMSKEKIDITDLLSKIVDEQSIKFTSNKQMLIFKPTRKKIMAWLDPFYLRMAIENMLDNAHKYSTEGTTTTVKLCIKKPYLEIDVVDEGVGIKKRDLPKLYKKFSRIDNPLSTSSGGTGLGLYWTKKIIKLHSGKIEVESKNKKGTTFTILIPKDSK